MTPSEHKEARAKKPENDKSDGRERIERIFRRADEIHEISGDDFWLRRVIHAMMEDMYDVKFDFRDMRKEKEAAKIMELEKERDNLKKKMEEKKARSFVYKLFHIFS